jgi:DNA-binding GntR family transcriptional regulator
MANTRSIQRERGYGRLRSMLLHGVIPPGTRLGEAAWAARLEVHRGALREVYGLLTHEGLLEPGARGGHFVPVIEQGDIDEVMELRVALETAAIHRLARLGISVDTQPLRATCATMRQMAEQAMLLGYVEADRRFHEQVIELAGNGRITRAYHQAPVLMSVHMEAGGADYLNTQRHTMTEHELICDYLDAGDFAQAARLLEAHLLTKHSATTGRPVGVGE